MASDDNEQRNLAQHVGRNDWPRYLPDNYRALSIQIRD